MSSFIEVSKKVLPDLLEVMQKRYDILRQVSQMEPVGRRSLAGILGMTERVLRGEVDFLKNQSLINVDNNGMSLTESGRQVLSEMTGMMKEIKGIDIKERLLAEKLGIQKAIIVPGNTDEQESVKNDLGKETASLMLSLFNGKNTIAVTGGSTMAKVAEAMIPHHLLSDLLFVPARGGVGADLNNQANTICAKMAERTNSAYRTLYVPDVVGNDMYQSMIKEPSIKEVLQQIKSANIVLHGIGDAITMAKRRETNESDLQKLKGACAVGEAFGYYFNEAGEVIHRVQTIGLQLDDLEGIQHVVAVAGGISKAKAIAAYMKRAPKNTVLITDEAAALKLLK
ncbi:central glycolytic genes regulator [Cytobacillus horneckiae]|uniref:Uncharacterized protein n=1 Tax=Cytobacillus horneckiae TaxID=549687 RepID=A0A2N0ZDR6_9BACI|nr:sugar-binding domain-containing protein [Cytobacillus horneckiae]MBN6885379.1 hypothetical protein [Cytobacillus horneckiae]MEC1154107.1 sugar-binding domain-containing protein [Cytobacillus horneckiae]MED2936348.1 sugar-binding domain-containing protein [Cytobacillus horneckiae]PKG27661.1 hypothetical protein CWS20_17560 [Cytobacillus horneckiae]